MKAFAPLAILILMAGIIACAEGSMTGKMSKASMTQASSESSDSPNRGPQFNADGEAITQGPSAAIIGPAEAGKVTGGAVLVEAPTDDELNAIASCSKDYGAGAPKFLKDKVRKIFAVVSVGTSGVTLEDEQRTDAPALTLIHASVAVLGSPEWNLLNPNGYYCIMAAVNVATKLTVNIDQQTHLADSTVSVNVLSQSDEAIASVGVNVGSKIKVVRK